MAESLAILGLASNIVSFIDFGFKLISACNTVRDSVHGTLPELYQLDLIVQNIEIHSAQCRRQLENGQQLSEEEVNILAMTSECNRLVTKMQKKLDVLKMRENPRWKLAQHVRIGWVALRNSDDIESLGRQLERLDRHIRDNVRESLQEEHHSATMSALNNIQRTFRLYNVKHQTNIEALRREVLHLLSRSEENRAANLGTHTAALTDLQAKLEGLRKEEATCKSQAKVLKSLYFRDMNTRREHITDAEEHTNAWLFDNPKSAFRTWLQSPASLYCVIGKAGSGKSTLMKFACRHEETTKALQTWASTSKLYIASFFFWNSGSEMEKSQRGLFQGLLYQILRNEPNLIATVCPERRNHETWTMKDLRATFMRLSEQTESSSKFCFFIDGLDEFEGAEAEVVDMLMFLSNSSHVKICASTRPRTMFSQLLFKDKRWTLVIEDFTVDDMKLYVRRTFQKSVKFQALKAEEPSTDSITEYIADTAQGDLESYFKRMFENIKPYYREEQAQMLLVAINSRRPLDLFAYYALEQIKRDPRYLFKSRIEVNRTRQMQKNDGSENEWEACKNRVHNRCGDLLVVRPQYHDCDMQQEDNSLLAWRVDFLHRTVRDFLIDSYYGELQRASGPDFASWVFLTQYYLSRLTLFQLSCLESLQMSSERYMRKLCEDLFTCAFKAE
ncbi:hypothetical protein K491DRAFT_757287 [Lophiostoma macrostomum CBS 122681]|uniref:Uncharacterized protein n=1 Tax=Lophiostoma macrostomum CBS 122681 TaxID=1314788 RepID=A0A6A6TB00_9PLEO|nr:hypothetical protein K491DRAFT_757287 [Lophiostoma macrostomum CBS 122681]